MGPTWNVSDIKWDWHEMGWAWNGTDMKWPSLAWIRTDGHEMGPTWNGTGMKWDTRTWNGTDMKWDGHEMARHDLANMIWADMKWPGMKWDIPIRHDTVVWCFWRKIVQIFGLETASERLTSQRTTELGWLVVLADCCRLQNWSQFFWLFKLNRNEFSLWKYIC